MAFLLFKYQQRSRKLRDLTQKAAQHGKLQNTAVQGASGNDTNIVRHTSTIDPSIAAHGQNGGELNVNNGSINIQNSVYGQRMHGIPGVGMPARPAPPKPVSATYGVSPAESREEIALQLEQEGNNGSSQGAVGYAVAELVGMANMETNSNQVVGEKGERISILMGSNNNNNDNNDNNGNNHLQALRIVSASASDKSFSFNNDNSVNESASAFDDDQTVTNGLPIVNGGYNQQEMFGDQLKNQLDLENAVMDDVVGHMETAGGPGE